MNEVKAYLDYRGLRYPLSFWRNYDGAEVDLLLETRAGFVAIEIKAAREWQRRFGNGLRLLQRTLPSHDVKLVGVFRGPRRLTSEGITVLPLAAFLRELWNDTLIT